MECKICDCSEFTVIYEGKIREGAYGQMTDLPYKMYQCNECGTIHHDFDIEHSAAYYQSKEYREGVDGGTSTKQYHKMHDAEVLPKLEYTGTEVFRDAVVADLGCGGGSFLDYISGAAKEIVAIEPSEEFRKGLSSRGYRSYAYAAEALEDYEGKIDVLTSFDVIEHVNDPVAFMMEAYRLMKIGAYGFIGTPTNMPVYCETLGKTYEEFLYCYQHPWILSEKSFRICCEKAGFRDIRIEYKQVYGLSNLISWLQYGMPKGHTRHEFITETLDAVYRHEVETQGNADFMVAYLRK